MVFRNAEQVLLSSPSGPSISRWRALMTSFYALCLVEKQIKWHMYIWCVKDRVCLESKSIDPQVKISGMGTEDVGN